MRRRVLSPTTATTPSSPTQSSTNPVSGDVSPVTKAASKKSIECQQEGRPTTTETTTSTSSALHFLNHYLFEGLGGTSSGSFFKPPPWVDLSKPPGTTSQVDVIPKTLPNLGKILSGHALVYTPNLIWFLISVLLYKIHPYDLESASSSRLEWWTHPWILQRTLINGTTMLIYFGFWHVVLYGWKWSQRPFCQGRQYTWTKLCHNVWYCLLGTLQWTAWEVIMVHLVATGRVGGAGISDADDTEPNDVWKQMLSFWCFLVLIPIYRELHFFFAHRMLHIRCFYKYIHALHHRNTDIEPFSGLCMSPAEHLYYISCIGPSIYWKNASLFMFLWNGMHMLLSPAASHSGWEDHWQSDQYHATHHRYFECNYGTPGVPFDRWFGTFRESLAPKTTCYQGAATECQTKNSAVSSEESEDEEVVIVARPDAKATLLGMPSWDQMVYYAATAIGLPAFVIYTTAHRADDTPIATSATLSAMIVALGPLILASVLSFVTASPAVRSWEGLRYTMLYPQHKEAIFGSFGLSLLFGTLVSIIPTYHFFHSLFVKDSNATIYHWIWDVSSTT